MVGRTWFGLLSIVNLRINFRNEYCLVHVGMQCPLHCAIAVHSTLPWRASFPWRGGHNIGNLLRT